jgi:1-acyl-sn-glycerol-3-phosphate acyltransferase
MIYRSSLLLIVVSTGCLLTILFQRNTMSRHGIASKITCWWHRRIIKAFNIKLRVHGQATNEATLFVANHLSWLDIHIIGSQLPARFLSKAEVQNWPIFGWLASKAGTLYIPRGGKNAAARANQIMQQALSNNQHVVLFPESTTSNGEIKRFHGRLMQSAINAQCLLQPVAIHYPEPDRRVHNAVLYVDDTTFIQSVKNVLAAKSIVAELHFLEPVLAGDKSRDELARHAEHQIKGLFNQSQND